MNSTVRTTTWHRAAFANPEAAASAWEKKDPRLLTALEELLRDATAGDPSSGLRWTHKTTQNLANAFRRLGFRVGRTSSCRFCEASVPKIGWIG